MFDVKAHIDNAQQRDETSSWNLNLQHQLNQMHLGVIPVKNLVFILFIIIL